MSADNFKEIDDSIRLHLQEAEFMKKEWISYVYSTIDGLSSKVNANSIQIQKEREYVITSLMELQEKITKELAKNNCANRADLKKLSKELDKFIKEIMEKFETVNDCIETSLDEHIEEEDLHFEELESEIKTISDAQLVIKTKLGVYVVVITLVITAITTTITGGILVLFRDVIKTWIGN